jgi:hypothetical protein
MSPDPHGVHTSPRGLSTSMKLMIGLAAAVAVVVTTAVGLVIVGNVFFSPEKHVEKYAAALADGDANRMLELAPGAYTPEESLLLTDDVLAGMDERVRDIEVHSIATDGDRSSVAITYRLGASASFLTVEVRRSSSRLGVFDEWEIVDPDLPTLDVRAEGATGLEVNGQVVDVDAEIDGDIELPVFPGDYAVTPLSGSRFLAYETKTASIGVPSKNLGFDAVATDDLQAEVERQGDAYLERCIAQREARPAGCPNQTFGYELRDVAWELATPPTYEIEPRSEGGWRFTAGTGVAHATGEEPPVRAGGATKDHNDTVAIDFGGTVQVDGDTVVVTPDRF